MSAKREEKPEPTTAAAEEKQSQQQLQYVGEKLAPFNPTNVDAINIAIDLLQIQDNDRLYDLGCGDARFLIQVRCYDLELRVK
jgi:cyclopropane fatty-acyl-phospholipid synthase-like methyltransferase